jgi:hypothetical protein
MMMDKEAPAVPVDFPIPGQSLTAPLGERPWQGPPRFTTVEKTLEYYIPKLTSDRMAGQALDLLESGVPVDTLVDTIQLGGVMEGIHSVDVGILASPILAEVIHQMAKSAGVKHKIVGEEIDPNIPDSSEISMAMKDAAKKKGESMAESATPVVEEVPMDEMIEEPKGLMARRA